MFFLWPILSRPRNFSANYDSANFELANFVSANFVSANFDLANFDLANFDLVNLYFCYNRNFPNSNKRDLV